MHLADAFIQSNLQCIQATQFFFCQYVCSLGIEPTTFSTANVILYHWATGTLNEQYFNMIMKTVLQLPIKVTEVEWLSCFSFVVWLTLLA